MQTYSYFKIWSLANNQPLFKLSQLKNKEQHQNVLKKMCTPNLFKLNLRNMTSMNQILTLSQYTCKPARRKKELKCHFKAQQSSDNFTHCYCVSHQSERRRKTLPVIVWFYITQAVLRENTISNHIFLNFQFLPKNVQRNRSSLFKSCTVCV